MAAMYAVYHGPEGLKKIANRVHGLAAVFAAGVSKSGSGAVESTAFFDTVKVTVPGNAELVRNTGVEHGVNLRVVDANTVRTSPFFPLFSVFFVSESAPLLLSFEQITVAFDETSTLEDVDTLFSVFSLGKNVGFTAESLASEVSSNVPENLKRESAFLSHPVFNMSVILLRKLLLFPNYWYVVSFYTVTILSMSFCAT